MGGSPSIMIYYPYTYKKVIRFGAVPYQRKDWNLQQLPRTDFSMFISIFSAVSYLSLLASSWNRFETEETTLFGEMAL